MLLIEVQRVLLSLFTALPCPTLPYAHYTLIVFVVLKISSHSHISSILLFSPFFFWSAQRILYLTFFWFFFCCTPHVLYIFTHSTPHNCVCMCVYVCICMCVCGVRDGRGRPIGLSHSQPRVRERALTRAQERGPMEERSRRRGRGAGEEEKGREVCQFLLKTLILDIFLF